MQDTVSMNPDFKLSGAPQPLAQSALLRQTMVDCQIRTFGVTDPRILTLMLEVRREQFLAPEQAALAYSDLALQLLPAASGGGGRWLLPPLVLARLLQDAEVKPDDSVLDIAPGTGYSTALLAGLGSRIVALESEPSLYQALRSNLDRLGLASAQAQLGPLAVGAPDEGPFDLIFINGKVETNLEALYAQLKDGGRLLALEGVSGDLSGRAGKAVRYQKTGKAIGYRVLFDASAPVLPDFKKNEQFTFS
jgi:protein-L-isoaspartate(D-aspartate) O-methyltransferase